MRRLAAFIAASFLVIAPALAGPASPATTTASPPTPDAGPSPPWSNPATAPTPAASDVSPERWRASSICQPPQDEGYRTQGIGFARAAFDELIRDQGISEDCERLQGALSLGRTGSDAYLTLGWVDGGSMYHSVWRVQAGDDQVMGPYTTASGYVHSGPNSVIPCTNETASFACD